MDIRKQIIEYIKAQVGVDVEAYRTEFTKRWERENEIIIEWREMPRKQRQLVEYLASRTNALIRLEGVGVWGKMIAYVDR